MTAEPLTRETLERLKRLRIAERAAFADYKASNRDDHYPDGTDYYDAWNSAYGYLWEAIDNDLDSLLAAAERGLGSGDGR